MVWKHIIEASMYAYILVVDQAHNNQSYTYIHACACIYIVYRSIAKSIDRVIEVFCFIFCTCIQTCLPAYLSDRHHVFTRWLMARGPSPMASAVTANESCMHACMYAVSRGLIAWKCMCLCQSVLLRPLVEG